MLSICLGGIAGSTGSDLTGVVGGVCERAGAVGRDSERVRVDPAGSGRSAGNGRGAVGSSWVRNWRIWSLCRSKSSLVIPIDCKT